jgi:hypothetical protein
MHDREELARIIDPEAFKPGTYTYDISGSARRPIALAKADQWLSRPSPVDGLKASLDEATSATMMAEMRADKWKDEVERLKSDVEVALEGWNITRDEMCKLVQYHIDRASAAEAKLQRLQSDVRAALTGDLTNG